MKHKWKKVNIEKYKINHLHSSNIKEVKQCIFCKILKKKHEYIVYRKRYTTKYYYQDDTFIGVIAPECKREFIKEEEFII